MELPPVVEARNEHMQNNILVAVHERQFFICLQPVFSLPERRIVAAEALLRWNEPDGGIIFPAEFIPNAQRVGLVELLDLFAVEEACVCMKKWMDSRQPCVPLSINLSSPSLQTPGFINAVSDCVMKHHIPPEMIVFEFAAEFLHTAPEKLGRITAHFRDLGYHCALSGFEGGVNALKHVKAFRIDCLKVNCRKYAPQDEEKGMHACLEVCKEARALDMDVVCEGVETPYHVRRLEEYGTIYAQGYALSVPVSVRLFRKMLQKQA